MHKFICKSAGGKIVPQQSNKLSFFNKLLNSYELLDKKFIVTIEIVEKNINEQQEGLYRAFILKASEHFGNTYGEMQMLLEDFSPLLIDQNSKQLKPLDKWTSKDLNDFINKASAHLSEYGFKFE